jgi:hypothetical protein
LQAELAQASLREHQWQQTHNTDSTRIHQLTMALEERDVDVRALRERLDKYETPGSSMAGRGGNSKVCTVFFFLDWSRFFCKTNFCSKSTCCW